MSHPSGVQAETDSLIHVRALRLNGIWWGGASRAVPQRQRDAATGQEIPDATPPTSQSEQTDGIFTHHHLHEFGSSTRRYVAVPMHARQSQTQSVTTHTIHHLEPGDAGAERDRSKPHSDQQQCRVHAPRPVTVEQYAQRQLEQREGEEIDSGEQAEAGCRQREFARQLRPDDRVDRAVDVGNEIPREERQGDAPEDGNYFGASRPPR